MANIEKAGYGEPAMMFKTWIGIKTFSSKLQIMETLSNNYCNENYWSIKGSRKAGYIWIMQLAAEVLKAGGRWNLLYFSPSYRTRGVREEACWHPYRLEMISQADELYLV